MKQTKRMNQIFIFITILLFVVSVLLLNVNSKRKALANENAEYLSVIEEYSVQYAELEDELTSSQKSIQAYKTKAKQYKERINKYKSQINQYKEKVEIYEAENEQYKEQLETVCEADDTDTTEVEYDYNYEYVTDSFTGNISAYCGCEECCGIYATNDDIKYGATGMQLISGYTVASDYYDMGTILYIEGYGEVQVADRFGAGHSKEYIDIYFDTHSEASAWQRQYLTVSVMS